MKRIGRTTTLAPIVLLAVVIFAGLAATASGANGLESAARPPGYIFSQNASQLVVVEHGTQASVELDISPIFRGDTSRFIESIEPIDSRAAFVGACCDPIEGRQLLVDLVDGSVEFFPFTVRFPATSEDGARYVAGGSAVSPNNLGAVLAYENGVGVVPPGPDLRERTDGVPFRPVILPGDRIAFVDVIEEADVLVVIDERGNELARSTLNEVRSIDYDERNNVVVALVGSDTMAILDAELLTEVSRIRLDAAVISIGLSDGWVLFVQGDGSLRAAPIGSPNDGEILVEADVETAAWLRSPASR